LIEIKAGAAAARLKGSIRTLAGRIAMRRVLAASLLVASLGAASAAAAAGPDIPASIDRGRQLALRNCAMCHATGETGDSPNTLAPRFRELHKRYPIENLQEALAEGILTGHPAMPEYRFAPNEITDLIRYLRSIQTRDEALDQSRSPPNTPILPR
jgi:mono/diheme cytochrome c family protein